MEEMGKHQRVEVVEVVEAELGVQELMVETVLAEMVELELQLLFLEVLLVTLVVQQDLVQVVEEVFLLRLGDQKLEIQQEQDKTLELIQVLVEVQHLRIPLLQMEVVMAVQV